jgi:hypothetical protein
MRTLHQGFRKGTVELNVDSPKLQPLVGEISWAKNLIIMSRCKDDLGREFNGK